MTTKLLKQWWGIYIKKSTKLDQEQRGRNHIGSYYASEWKGAVSL